ncbi:MAG: transglycosylase SLT domain-containing protein, partial [Alphaproteobacteria bacterium]
LINHYRGSYVLALAAYNAGPARVKRWIRNNGDPRDSEIDVIDWIEMIPFEETRDYVQRVLENVQMYRVRTGKSSAGIDLETDLNR